MYFNFDDRHPDFERIDGAISWREGLLLSLVIHLLGALAIVLLPEALPGLFAALAPDTGGEEDTVRQLRPPVDGLAHSDIDFDPQGRYLFVVFNFEAWLVPLDGGAWLPVVPRDPARQLLSGAVSPSGALVAAAFFGGQGERTISVFEVATGTLRSFPLPAAERPGEMADSITNLEFLDEQTLLTAGLKWVERLLMPWRREPDSRAGW